MNCKTLLGIIICSIILAACQSGSNQLSEPESYQRIVSLSGAITETLFTLGHGDKIIGVDITSTYPSETNTLTKLGHVRQLNAEGVLGLQPDLIIMENSDNNSAAIKQLEQSGIPILYLEKPNNLDAPLQMARRIAQKLGDPKAKLSALEQKIQQEKQQLQALLAQHTERPKVLFIYARGKGNLMVAGKNTSAEAMINAAGGQNAMIEFEDFKSLSVEGLIKAQPEVILMFESGLQSLDGADELLKIPGISQTPAGQNRRIIAMDGHYLLGFGPRSAQAALELAQKIASAHNIGSLSSK